MNRKTALKLLQSSSSHQRLMAARYLARNARQEDLKVINQARSGESVTYVRSSLALCIKRLSNEINLEQPILPLEFEVPENLRRQIYTKAVEEVAGFILHEITPKIGLTKVSANRECNNYENSETKKHLDSIENIFDAIEQLQGAAGVPKREEFDLTELLKRIVYEQKKRFSKIEVSYVGKTPFLVNSDKTLLTLAISNGVRNSFEAVSEVKNPEQHSVVITWGETDVDYFVSILDQGVGFVGNSEAAFEFGKSNKDNHIGFGLPIARQAIESLNGTVQIEPNSDGGARFEVRWEQ